MWEGDGLIIPRPAGRNRRRGGEEQRRGCGVEGRRSSNLGGWVEANIGERRAAIGEHRPAASIDQQVATRAARAGSRPPPDSHEGMMSIHVAVQGIFSLHMTCLWLFLLISGPISTGFCRNIRNPSRPWILFWWRWKPVFRSKSGRYCKPSYIKRLTCKF